MAQVVCCVLSQLVSPNLHQSVANYLRNLSEDREEEAGGNWGRANEKPPLGEKNEEEKELLSTSSTVPMVAVRGQVHRGKCDLFISGQLPCQQSSSLTTQYKTLRLMTTTVINTDPAGPDPRHFFPDERSCSVEENKRLMGKFNTVCNIEELPVTVAAFYWDSCYHQFDQWKSECVALNIFSPLGLGRKFQFHTSVTENKKSKCLAVTSASRWEDLCVNNVLFLWKALGPQP